MHHKIGVVFHLSLITSVITTPLSTPQDIPSQRSPLTLAPFYTLQAEHPDKNLNHSYIVMLKDDLHTPTLDNHFNFLQAAHEDPLLADGPVCISIQRSPQGLRWPFHRRRHPTDQGDARGF
jgi:hypothetical protein